MGSNEAYENDPVFIVDTHDQSILVAADVKDRAMVSDNACRAIRSRDVGWRGPVGFGRDGMPGAKRLFGLAVLFQKLSQRPFGDNTHSLAYTSQTGMSIGCGAQNMGFISTHNIRRDVSVTLVNEAPCDSGCGFPSRECLRRYSDHGPAMIARAPLFRFIECVRRNVPVKSLRRKNLGSASFSVSFGNRCASPPPFLKATIAPCRLPLAQLVEHLKQTGLDPRPPPHHRRQFCHLGCTTAGLPGAGIILPF